MGEAKFSRARTPALGGRPTPSRAPPPPPPRPRDRARGSQGNSPRDRTDLWKATSRLHRFGSTPGQNSGSNRRRGREVGLVARKLPTARGAHLAFPPSRLPCAGRDLQRPGPDHHGSQRSGLLETNPRHYNLRLVKSKTRTVTIHFPWSKGGHVSTSSLWTMFSVLSRVKKKKKNLRINVWGGVGDVEEGMVAAFGTGSPFKMKTAHSL